MLQIAILTYGFLAILVLQATSANRREGRAHGAAVLFTGRMLMAASFTLGAGATALLMAAGVGLTPLPALPSF